MKEYNDIETLDKLLKLWINSIDCIGLECKNCNKDKICKKVCEINKLIEEMDTNEEL